jgi:hypothetical protein
MDTGITELGTFSLERQFAAICAAIGVNQRMIKGLPGQPSASLHCVKFIIAEIADTPTSVNCSR